MKKYICLGLMLFSILFTRAEGYNIKIDIKEAANENVLLTYFYNGRIMIADTFRVDEFGKAALTGKASLPQGLYKIYLTGEKHFNFLLGSDQDLLLKTSDLQSGDLTITGAPESEEFLKYTIYLSEIQNKGKELNEKKKDASDDEIKQIDKELETITANLEKYWKEKTKQYPGSFLSVFLMANYVPKPNKEDIPEEIAKNDSALLQYNFDFQKQHFFDHFDVSDERLFYTPLLKPKIENYFTKILYQTYDSISVGMLELIEKSRPSKLNFQYITSYTLNSSINSKIIGMDALFVKVAQKYYLSGIADWATKGTLEKIKENVTFAKDNLIGLTAPELKLESLEGEVFSLHQIDAKITIVLIYEPNCSHCKVFVPELYEKVYKKYQNKDFEIFAIYSMDNKEEWQEFIDQHGLHNWINVWDEHHYSRFKITYDARKTPGVYILDENKKIITKKLSVDQILAFLEKELGE